MTTLQRLQGTLALPAVLWLVVAGAT